MGTTASRGAFGLLGLLMACGGTTETEAPGPIRPVSTSVRTLDASRYELPEVLRGGPVHVGSGGAGELFVGGTAGLFRWDIDRFVEVTATPVQAIAGDVIATDELSVLSTTLERSPLTDDIDGAVGAMAWRGDELWLATASMVYRYVEGDGLYEFDGLTGVTGLSAFSGSAVVFTTANGPLALREDGSGFTERDLSAETGGTVVPSHAGRFLASENGALLERTVVDDFVMWRGVALTMDGPAATDVRFLLADPATGASIAITDSNLYRLEGGAVFESSFEDAALTQASVTRDGAVWLGDGTSLWRYAEIETVTYAEHIAPFFEANCERCHTAVGTARALDTFESWTENVDAIVAQLEERKMPADGMPLVGGGIDLVKRWKTDGLQP